MKKKCIEFSVYGKKHLNTWQTNHFVFDIKGDKKILFKYLNLSQLDFTQEKSSKLFKVKKEIHKKTKEKYFRVKLKFKQVSDLYPEPKKFFSDKERIHEGIICGPSGSNISLFNCLKYIECSLSKNKLIPNDKFEKLYLELYKWNKIEFKSTTFNPLAGITKEDVASIMKTAFQEKPLSTEDIHKTLIESAEKIFNNSREKRKEGVSIVIIN